MSKTTPYFLWGILSIYASMVVGWSIFLVVNSSQVGATELQVNTSHQIYPVSLQLNPGSQTVTSGSTLTSTITLDTNGQPISQVDIILTFPSNLLSVSQITPNFNFCPQISTKVTTDENQIEIICVAMPQKTQLATIGTITWKSLEAGEANLQVSPQSELDSTSSNQNLLRTFTMGHVTITP